jgi:hypothetical protein
VSVATALPVHPGHNSALIRKETVQARLLLGRNSNAPKALISKERFFL